MNILTRGKCNIIPLNSTTSAVLWWLPTKGHNMPQGKPDKVISSCLKCDKIAISRYMSPLETGPVTFWAAQTVAYHSSILCNYGLYEARNTDSNLPDRRKCNGSGKTIFKNTSKKINVWRLYRISVAKSFASLSHASLSNYWQEIHEEVAMSFAEQHFKCDSFSQTSRDSASCVTQLPNLDTRWRKSSFYTRNWITFTTITKLLELLCLF